MGRAVRIRELREPQFKLESLSVHDSKGAVAVVQYCATKFYVSTFTEGLAWELIESGAKMRAKVLAPAATQTEFGKKANNVDSTDRSTVLIITSSVGCCSEISRFKVSSFSVRRAATIKFLPQRDNQALMLIVAQSMYPQPRDL